MKRTVAAHLFVFLICSQAFAQDKPKKIGWSNAAELSYVFSSGNSEARTLALRDTLLRVWTDAEFKLEASALRNETSTSTVAAIGTSATDFVLVENTRTEVAAENYFVRGRYDRNLSKKLFVFVSSGWDRNVPAGVQNRIFGAGGIGNTWFEDDNRKLKTNYGISITNQDNVVDDPDVSDTFAGLRATAEYMRKLTGNTTYNFLTIVDENLSNGDDFRMDMTNAVSVAMTQKLALKVSLQFLFDNLPSLQQATLLDPGTLLPTGLFVGYRLDKWDTFFTVALVITY